MNRRIWTFGDSFTESFSDNNADWVSKYTDWKGYVPKVYGEVIAEEMGLELVNMGKGGSDNYSILQSICDSVRAIDKDDIILIGWSTTTRFRLVSKYGFWKPIIPNFDKNLRNLENISKDTIDEVLVNRTHNLYIDEVRSWIKLLDYTFSNNTLIHWSPLEYGAAKNHFKHLETIRTETNGVIDDGHYSESGHKELGKILMDMIYNNKKRNLI